MAERLRVGVHIRRPWFKSKRGLQGFPNDPFLPARLPTTLWLSGGRRRIFTFSRDHIRRPGDKGGQDISECFVQRLCGVCFFSRLHRSAPIENPSSHDVAIGSNDLRADLSLGLPFRCVDNLEFPDFGRELQFRRATLGGTDHLIQRAGIFEALDDPRLNELCQAVGPFRISKRREFVSIYLRQNSLRV